MNGIICINKPEGFTSFDVIAKLRGILKMRRLGHSGTLDPMATGVLVIFAGQATKACNILPDEDKIYLAEFALGKISDTQDSTGKILEEHNFFGITKKQIQAVCPEGEIMQIPPMYSAVSVNGKRLYELAREGKVIERQARAIQIRQMSCEAYNELTGTGTLKIHCSKGTYVRTLIHDMGHTLGCGAVMTGLTRISASGFSLEQAYTLEEIQQLADDNRAEQAVIPIEQAFSSLPALHLTEKQTIYYKNGVKLGLSQFHNQLAEAHSRYAVYGSPDGFLGTALTDTEQDCLRVERNLTERK